MGRSLLDDVRSIWRKRWNEDVAFAVLVDAWLGTDQGGKSLTPAETTDGDWEINAPADRDSVSERRFETCLVDHADRIIDPQAESGGFRSHTQHGTEEIGRDSGAGRSGEGKVPERVDAGTATERPHASEIDHVEFAE
nr:hypothetical protein [Falsiroseomonas bella]